MKQINYLLFLHKNESVLHNKFEVFMKKLIVILLMLITFNFMCFTNIQVYALDMEPCYTIYDSDGDYLFERISVEVGDEFIDKDFNTYVVVSVDDKARTGIAKFVKSYREDKPLHIKKPLGETKKIGVYMSHNDESYVSGDGYDSVYGAGGIHDVAKEIKKSLEQKGVVVTLDETLHIPHDKNAYSRSKVTATKILNQTSPDAIFDIHRDGTSRGFYVTKVGDKERCMVRIVIGKSNPNMSLNKDFAINLMRTAKEVCPWLFVDLFIGQGHYNQALHSRAVLFEMGSHLVEKDLVMQTVSELTNVVYKTIYGDDVIEDELPSGGVDDLNHNENNTTSEENENDGDILTPNDPKQDNNIQVEDKDIVKVDNVRKINETIQAISITLVVCILTILISLIMMVKRIKTTYKI